VNLPAARLAARPTWRRIIAYGASVAAQRMPARVDGRLSGPQLLPVHQPRTTR
jgi:hypothetical protein